ncbi:uncharacterized protein VTP21DRAFT_11454 [Calcarisporiella thermophila]|uniref:uncharacterized protein n=1 Tax=Calcarisporiella thermophila TaxID=911321 RepID=UPI0037430888
MSSWGSWLMGTPSDSRTSSNLSTLSNFGNTGRVGLLTPAQQTALTRFKDEIQKEGLYDEKRHTDHLLLRFLRARKFDHELTMTMFRNCEQWRKEFRVEELVRNFDFPEGERIARIYPRYYHKIDRLGRPIYVEHLGKIDINEMFQITTEDRMIQAFVVSYEGLMNERFPACSLLAGRNIEQCFTILDLQGLSLMQVPSALGFIRRTSAIAQDYYPEMMGKMYVINAPMLFSTVWSMIRPFLDEVTVNKIVIPSANVQQELLKDVEPENLPAIFGGKCQCPEGCDRSNAGPWCDPEYNPSLQNGSIDKN